MRKRYFREEDVFGFIWEAADEYGMWKGNDHTLATAFSVTENEAYAVLADLCGRNRLQRIENSKYIIVRWHEKDDAGDEKMS